MKPRPTMTPEQLAAWEAEIKAGNTPPRIFPAPGQHGKNGTYTQGCRCVECLDAANAHNRAYHAQIKYLRARVSRETNRSST